MSTYLARLKANHEIVGIFSVDHDHELYWLVDEVTDPALVELTPLGTGGIVWLSPGAASLPIEENSDGEQEFPHGATVSENWAGSLHMEVPADQWRDVPPRPGSVV